MSPEQISQRYDLWIVVRRWVATWMDQLFFAAVTAGLVFLARLQLALALEIGAVFLLFYYPVCEGLLGKTLGKLLCGLTVVDAQGGRPGFSRAIVRSLWRLLEINPLLVGGIPAGIAVYSSKSRQRVGDAMAKTFVLADEDLSGSGKRRRAWAVPGAALTTLATVGFFTFSGVATQSVARQKPVTISLAKFAAAPPDDGWFQVTNCPLDLSDALFEKRAPYGDESAPPRVATAYIPVHLKPGTKTPLLLKTEDEGILKILRKLDALEEDEKNKKVLETYIEAHGEEFFSTRSLSGTIAKGDSFLVPSGEDFDTLKRDELTENFVILNEGDKPFSTEAIVAILAGVFLGVLTTILWFVALIYATSGPPVIAGSEK